MRVSREDLVSPKTTVETSQREGNSGAQWGQKKRGAGHTPSPREAAGVAGADATCPKVAAQASLKHWAPAVCPPPIFPGLHRLGPPCTPGHVRLCSRVPGSGICPACSPLVLHVAHNPSRPLWSRLRTPLCPRGWATGTAYPPEGSPRGLCMDQSWPTCPPHTPRASPPMATPTSGLRSRHPRCPIPHLAGGQAVAIWESRCG